MRRLMQQHHWRGGPNFQLRRIPSALLSGSPRFDAGLESVEAVLGMARSGTAVHPPRRRLLLMLLALLRPSPCLEVLLCSLCQTPVLLQTDYYYWHRSDQNRGDFQRRKLALALGGYVAARSLLLHLRGGCQLVGTCYQRFESLRLRKG